MSMQTTLSTLDAQPVFEVVQKQKKSLPAVSIVGLGYVGAVSTACLSGLGHRVVGVDLDEKKVATIASGEAPIHEKYLEELLSRGVARYLITATTDLHSAVLDTDITFVSVGTPSAEVGGCDMTAINAVAAEIGEALKKKRGFHTVVMRCSIPPGTTSGVMVPTIEKISGKVAGEDFGVCFNPEFLREGTAVEDFHNPPKTVIGVSDEKTASIVKTLYQPVDEQPLISSIEVAEMVKYVDNVWHATKVCFANEMGRICKGLEVDSHSVMDIFVQDTKLNLSPYYLKPGFAFGGSCLPKEVRAMGHLSDELGVSTPLIKSLVSSNEDQIEAAIDAMRKSGAKRIGFLGAAFKPGTDDLRESPILNVMEAALSDGLEIEVFDSAIRPGNHLDAQLSYLRQTCPELQRTLFDFSTMLSLSAEAVVDGCDLVIVSHRNVKFQKLLSKQLGNKKVIDVVRLFDEVPTGSDYFGIGW
ncbi:MAG: nucleotide sugar dehydrogenase [Hyphomicrobiales bacterium]